MTSSTAHNPGSLPAKPLRESSLSGCLSCGVRIDGGRRRYCSVACRQRLRRQLNLRTGLLKALEVRYAGFHFNEMFLFLDVLPVQSVQIYSFWYLRGAGQKPANDFIRLADQLGERWWAEKKRTNKRYVASRQLLVEALKNQVALNSLTPDEILQPKGGGKSFMYLKLDRRDLGSRQFKLLVKSAYRREVMRHHPDHGGRAATFRRIQSAYELLIDWAENPTFIKRRGLPDKWFYSGHTNRWVQPLNARR